MYVDTSSHNFNNNEEDIGRISRIISLCCVTHLGSNIEWETWNIHEVTNHQRDLESRKIFVMTLSE